MHAGLLREDHREVAEHGEQDARDGISDREADPGYRALDLDRGFAARAGVGARASDAAHQDRRIDLEDVVADRPDDEGRDGAGDESDNEDLRRNCTGELSQQASTGIDANDGDKDNEAEIFQHVARSIRRIAEETQPRHDRRHDHAGQQQSTGIAEADLGAEGREFDLPDQEADDHADRQRQQVGGRVAAGYAAPHLTQFVDGRLQTDDRDDIHPLQFSLETGRNGHAAALDPADLQLTGQRLIAERLKGASNHLLVGNENVGLIERNIERLGVGDLGTDQAHLFGEVRGRAAQRDDVPLLQHEARIGPHRFSTTQDVGDAILGIGLAETLDALADLG